MSFRAVLFKHYGLLHGAHLKEYNDDGSDLVIFKEQNNDLDYLVSKCKVAYKDWLIENEGGY